MGLKGRLGAAKRFLWSPMEVGLLGSGSDEVVRAGQPASVIVEVSGEDDGTIERIEVLLQLNYTQTWPLGEVPTVVGTHTLTVEIPAEAPPTSRYTHYVFKGVLHRSKGTGSDGVSPVRVIGHADHVYWPEGPGSEGEVITLDADTVEAGGVVSGHASEAGVVEVGAVLDSIRGEEGRPNGVHEVDFKKVGEMTLDAPGPFRIDIPVGVPPTLHDGGTTYLTWEARAANGWRRFAVLDPDGLAEVPKQKPAGLLDIFY